MDGLDEDDHDMAFVGFAAMVTGKFRVSYDFAWFSVLRQLFDDCHKNSFIRDRGSGYN